jgi:opacity protein-like surface antigen
MALASTTLAAPAVAQDTGWYAGVEGGALVAEDTNLDYADNSVDVDNGITLDHSIGFDADLVGGYDLGMFRLEAEAGYKRAKVDEIRFDPSTGIFATPAGLNPQFVEANGRFRVISTMVNALADFDGDGWRGYAGVGVGLARVKYSAFTDDGVVGFSDRDNTKAWQGIAGVAKTISPNTEVGLKYRYFNTGRLDFGRNDVSVAVPFALSGRLKTHSLLASLIFNFRAPPPPPPPVVVEAPPPPPPPATQTCPDGSVILATDACPVPPPPPPPPPSEPERG